MTETRASNATSVRFTEEMKGFAALETTEFEAGRDLGRSAGTSLMFHLTIEIPDIDAFLVDPLRSGRCQGWVGAEWLGGRLPVEQGDFNLFVEDDDPGQRWMRYRLRFRDGAGHPLTLVGFKDVKDDAGFDVWSDTSTLFVRILRGHVDPGADAVVVAAGILTIWKRDFARQLLTFRASGPSIGDRVRALAAFVSVFMGQLRAVYVDEPTARRPR